MHKVELSTGGTLTVDRATAATIYAAKRKVGANLIRIERGGNIAAIDLDVTFVVSIDPAVSFPPR